MNEHSIMDKDKVIDYIRSVVTVLPIQYIKPIQEKMEYLEKYYCKNHTYEEHKINIGEYDIVIFYSEEYENFKCWINDKE